MSEQVRRPVGVVYGDRIWPTVAGYELVARYYDQWYWQSFWTANERPLIVEEIEKLGPQCVPALDVGTGTGLYLVGLVSIGVECVGIDACPAMLEEAKKKLPPSVKLICATAENLPFPDKSFGLVTACRVFSHIADVDSAMEELGRVTNTYGRMVLSDVSALHNYTTTRIPTSHGDVHIETHKHTVGYLMAAAVRSGYWRIDKVKSVAYKDLLWKPQPFNYPAIDVSSKRPIFFYGVLTRLKTD